MFPPSPQHPRVSILFRDIDGSVKMFIRGDVEAMRGYVDIPANEEYQFKGEGLRVACCSFKYFTMEELAQVQQNLMRARTESADFIFNMINDIEKDGTISNVLKQGQEVIVQIVKEPISTKGPRLTCELSFAGRYLVLIPFNDKVSVSQKIKSSAERARLKQLLQSIKPKNFGIIVRTVAEGKRVAELDAELKVLLRHWEETITKAQKATKMPTLV